jgi:hypothetical protein
MSKEARARLSARNKETQVWKLARNTGAKTPEGRKKVGQNAVKDGARGAGMVALVGWLRSIKALITPQPASQTKSKQIAEGMKID